MKKFAPVVFAGFLLAPCLASAQGYPGLMSPQQGYQAPRAAAEKPEEAAPPADESEGGAPAAGLPGGALPYGGTGTDTHGGHVTVSGPGAGAAGDEAQGDSGGEAADGNASADKQEADEDDADHGSGSPAPKGYADSLAPKEKPWVDPNQAKNLYDFVQAATPGNRANAPARQAQAQADAALRAQREEIDHANAERMQQQNEAISASAAQIQAANQKKQDDAADGIDSSQDAAP